MRVTKRQSKEKGLFGKTALDLEKIKKGVELARSLLHLPPHMLAQLLHRRLLQQRGMNAFHVGICYWASR
jgi:hypothetical protein